MWTQFTNIPGVCSVLPRIFLRDRGLFFLVVLTGFNHKMGGGQK